MDAEIIQMFATPMAVPTFCSACPACGVMVSGEFVSDQAVFTCSGSGERKHAGERWTETDDASDLQTEKTYVFAPGTLHAEASS